MRRLRKWLLYGLASLALLLAAAAGAAYWSLMHTQPGAEWLFGRAADFAPGRLDAAELEGDLGSGLRIDRLVYDDAAARVSAGRLAVQAGWEFRPLTLRIRALDISELMVQPREADTDEEYEAGLEELLRGLRLPLAVALDRAEVTGLIVAGPDDAPLFQAERLFLAGRLDDRLVIERLDLAADSFAVGMDGSLGLDDPFPVDGSIQGRFEDGPFESAEASAEFGGRLSDWRASLNGSLRGVDVGATQAIDLDFRTLGQGGQTQLTLDALELVGGEALRLSGSAGLDWSLEPVLSFDAASVRLAPAFWSPEWPAGETIDGRAAGRVTGDSLEVDNAEFRHAGGDARLELQGRFDLEQGIASGELAWDGLRWPLTGSEPRIGSPVGRVSLSGSPDDWSLQGRADVEGQGVPPGELSLAAQGDRDCALLSSLGGAALGGTFRGDGELCWTGDGAIRSDLSATGLNIGALLPDWPGRVDVEAGISGLTARDEYAIDVRRFEGELRGYPVAGGGFVQLRDGDVELQGVRLRSGSNTLQIDGRLGAAEGVTFAAELPALNELSPQASGRLAGSGVVSIDPVRPRLELDLEASDLSLGGLVVDQLRVSGAPGDGAGITALTVDAESLSFQDISVDRASGRLGLGDRRQELRLVLERESERAQIALSGESSARIGGTEFSWEDLLASRWAGSLDTLDYSGAELPTLELIEPAGLNFSAEEASIEDVCLTAGSGSRLCLAGQLSRDQALTASLDIEQVPLSLLRPWLGEELVVTQLLQGKASARLPPGEELSAAIDLGLTPGRISRVGREDPLLTTGEGRLVATVSQGRVSAGRFDLPLEGNGEINLDFEVPDLRAGGEGAINGRLHLLLTDLDLVSHFVDGLDEISGRFESELDLGGSWARPRFSGYTRLSDGVVENYGLGLRFSDIFLNGTTDGAAVTELDGHFMAREGRGQLAARLDLSDLARPRMDLQLDGDHLLLVDAADLRVVSSPDLRISWDGEWLELGGRVDIPAARISPRSIPGATVSESPDLQIVAGEIPRNGRDKAPARDWRVRGDLDLVLGKDVVVNLDVATAQLGGQANFAWRDSPQPVVNGGLDLVGQIQAFGQSLRITDGKIAWTESPASNPHLNIRAERQIYGNSEIRRAGVFVTGTLRRIVIEPFTDPMTDRERARTLLVTGSDFNMEKGVGAVNVGTYIAPRLFVAYGIGVFEDDNVLSIRYDLARNWGVRATSGQRGTGVDIVYTIER